jgi:hypothetical protein
MIRACVNKCQAPTQISLDTINSRPSQLRNFRFHDIMISVVTFLGPLLPKPEMLIRQNVWPCPSPQLYHVLRLQEFHNKEPLPLVFKKFRNAKPRRVQQRLASQRDFSPIQSFRLRNFANLDARLPMIPPSKPQNGQQSFDSAW